MAHVRKKHWDRIYFMIQQVRDEWGYDIALYYDKRLVRIWLTRTNEHTRTNENSHFTRLAAYIARPPTHRVRNSYRENQMRDDLRPRSWSIFVWCSEKKAKSMKACFSSECRVLDVPWMARPWRMTRKPRNSISGTLFPKIWFDKEFVRGTFPISINHPFRI